MKALKRELGNIEGDRVYQSFVFALIGSVTAPTENEDVIKNLRYIDARNGLRSAAVLVFRQVIKLDQRFIDDILSYRVDNPVLSEDIIH